VSEDEGFEITEDNPEVRLAYGSNTNISFAGTIETGYSRREWDSFKEKEKDEIIEERVWELIEIWELADGDPDYYPGSRW
jgi:hypothetical protein